MSKRTVTVGVGSVSVSKGWGRSTLTIETAERKAVIEIRDPWELRYLRLQLDLIEEGWKRAMEELASK
jgi:hypothetical protein